MIACAYGNSRCINHINHPLGTPRIERHQGSAASIAPHPPGGRVARSCICTMSLTHAHVTVVQYAANPAYRTASPQQWARGWGGRPALARKGLQHAREAHAADQMSGDRRACVPPFVPSFGMFSMLSR